MPCTALGTSRISSPESQKEDVIIFPHLSERKYSPSRLCDHPRPHGREQSRDLRLGFLNPDSAHPWNRIQGYPFGKGSTGSTWFSKEFGDLKSLFLKVTTWEKVVTLFPLKPTMVIKEIYIQFSICTSTGERAGNCEVREKNSSLGHCRSLYSRGNHCSHLGLTFFNCKMEDLGQMESEVLSKILWF